MDSPHTISDNNEITDKYDILPGAALQIEFHGGKNSKKRKRSETSPVWPYFDKIPGATFPDKKERAECKMCGAEYIIEGNAGTGNLNRHLKSCVKMTTHDIRQMFFAKSEGSVTFRQKFDAQRFRELVAAAIIRHDLPFQFIDYEGIRAIFSYLCDDVQQITRNTAKADALKMHNREKMRIKRLLEDAPGRICLTSDMWTSINTDGYMSLTAHFLDKDWVLQKRLLNFCFLPPPHNGVSLSEKVSLLLSDWGIENKLFSITLDNARCNDVFVSFVKSQLIFKKALVSSGDFFHIQWGLKQIDKAVEKIRETVKYFRGSQVRKVKFFDSAKQMSIDCKRGLRQDVPTRWNSTFLMLKSALYYRRAFGHLELLDSNYKNCPTAEERGKVEKITKFLGVFYDITCIFSGTKYPTSNLYFPKVFLALLTLKQHLQSDDEYMKSMATQMHIKFLKYWKDFSSILAIATILDPRYKMQFIDFAYKKVYGKDSNEFKLVQVKLFSLFSEYISSSSSNSSITSANKNDGDGCFTTHDLEFNQESVDIMKEFDAFECVDSTTSVQKTQLELYLDEPKVDRNGQFDNLSYWKGNECRYPELSSMARDILSIPISTVASESAFSNGGRVLDQFHSALKPDTVEALVCTRDWLFADNACELSLEELTEDLMGLNINKEDAQTPTAPSSSVHLG